jgi:hypothetical protein
MKMANTFRTLTLSVALAGMFLSAGAFAGADRKNPAVPTAQAAKVTIIHKNSAWPVKGLITTDACKVMRCVEA